MDEKNKKIHIKKKRRAAVTLKADLDEGDKLSVMITRESGLFIISQQKIIRYRSPDDIDPHLQDASAFWEQSLILPHGASDPIVARTIIQTKKILEFFFSPNDQKYIELSDISWEIMNSLVSLRFIKQRLEKKINGIIKTIKADPQIYTDGENPKPLPIVEYYDIEFMSFVNEVRRALSIIADLFLPLTGLSEFSQGHFHKAQKWAKENRGEDSILAQMLSSDQKWIKTWIDIRIAIEHPEKNKFVETMNFTLELDRTVRLPTWRFIHPDYNMKNPQNLLEVMDICMANLLKFYEDLQIALLAGHSSSKLKFGIDPIPENSRDKELPLRYNFGYQLP
jgi:hypothetical protein